MKILIATGIFPPQIGGPATYSKLLYDELPKRGVDVEVATFGDYIDRPKLVRHFLYFKEVLRKAANADIVYAQDPVSVGLPALLAAQIRGKKLVLKIVGDYAWEQATQRFGVTDTLDKFAKGYHQYPIAARVLKKVERYVADGADRIIVPSGYLKRIVTDWGVDPNKIDVVYNGFHLKPSKTLRATLRKSLGFMGSIIITVGRLVPWKGIGLLIDIMPEVIERVPDAKLIVAGDGPDREKLEGVAKARGVEGRVLFTGRLPQAELFDCVRAADVFALNTSYEGFSHQILESMALGTPVVTTDVGGNPEVIKHGRSGALLAPNDREGFIEALVGILSERAVAFTIAKEAKKAVSRFTDEAMLENLVKVLRAVDATPAKGAPLAVADKGSKESA